MSGRGDGSEQINSIDFKCVAGTDDILKVYEPTHSYASYNVILEMRDAEGKQNSVFLDADKAFELAVAVVAVAQNHKNRSK